MITQEPLIKICGLTNKEDALLACEFGAHLVGLIFAEKSKRRVDIEQAREIVAAIWQKYNRVQLVRRNGTISPQRLLESFGLRNPKGKSLDANKIHSVGIVGVFMDQPAEFVQQVMTELDLDFCQLHGDEEYESSIAQPVIKVIPVQPDVDDNVKSIREKMKKFTTKLILLDTKTLDGQSGGTGIPFNWRIGRRLAGYRKNFMLAGGINAGNVVDAIKSGAWALDVCSGVEESPGRKSETKMRDLFEAVHDECARSHSHIQSHSQSLGNNQMDAGQSKAKSGPSGAGRKGKEKQHSPNEVDSKGKVANNRKKEKKNQLNRSVNAWNEELAAVLSQGKKAESDKIQTTLSEIESILEGVKLSSPHQASSSASGSGAGACPKSRQRQEHKKQNGRGGRRDYYRMHLEYAEWKPLVEKNPEMYLKGAIRINRRQRRLAYVSVDGMKHDIVIVGNKDQNRALEGDLVVVELIGEARPKEFDKMRGGTETFLIDGGIGKKGTDHEEEEDDEDPFDDVDAEDDVIHPIGRVISIEERRPGRVYAGFLMPPNWSPDSSKQVAATISDEGELENKKNGQKKAAGNGKGKSAMPRNVIFRPSDKRVPLIMIDVETCPKDFVSKYEKFEDKIFVCSFKRWPENSRYPYGKFGKVIGKVGEILVETEAIIESNSIRDSEFSTAVKSCLPQIPWMIPEDEISRRRDLRNDCIFTIDPETAKDLDDAVSCTVLEDGNYLVGVHIADVSFFVKPGTALDREAFERATTTYLVQRAIPMLPGVLCEDLCSLNPGVDRLAFSVMWKMDRDGNILDTWFGRTVIKSCVKLNYDQAQKLIDGMPWSEAVGRDLHGDHDIPKVVGYVKIFHQLSLKMRKRRFDNGALTINQPKLTFRLDETGHPNYCAVYEIKDSNRLIEEFMLLANMSVAERISNRYPKWAMLRCHPPPNQRTMTSFLSYCEKMGYKLDARTAGSLQNSIQAIEDVEKRQIFQLLAIKPMQRAKYISSGQFDKPQWRHYALSVDLYTHFTSPIRRYADVVVHRLLQDALDDKEPDSTLKQDVMATKSAKQCNLKKEDARQSQDSSSKLFLCIYLQRLEKTLGREIILDAIIMDFGEKSFDVYVPQFALDKRVNFGSSGALTSTINSAKNQCIVTWDPEKKDTLPPFDDEAAKEADPKKLKAGYVTEYRPAVSNPLTRTLRILDHIKCRLCVTGKSPLDVSVYMLHPSNELPVIPESTIIASQADIMNSTECLLDETLQVADG